MQEITRWVADDGKEFEFEEDCEDYECECIFNELKNDPDIKFFDANKVRLTFNSFEDFCYCVNDIVYFTGCRSLGNFLTMDVNGVDFGYRADFPCSCDWWGDNADVIAWNEETEEWDNLSARFKELHKTLKKIAES